MPEDQAEGAIPTLYKKISGASEEDTVFSTEGPDTTLETVSRIITAANTFHDMAISEFGGRPGSEREEGLVENVIGAAFQTFEGVDPHPGDFDKAAMLMRGITQGHPFTDGNKRTGFLTAAYYLGHVGHPLPVDISQDEVTDFCLKVSAGEIRDVEVIAQGLQRFWKPSGRMN